MNGEDARTNGEVRDKDTAKKRRDGKGGERREEGRKE